VHFLGRKKQLLKQYLERFAFLILKGNFIFSEGGEYPFYDYISKIKFMHEMNKPETSSALRLNNKD
jgi:hypothetical protein